MFQVKSLDKILSVFIRTAQELEAFIIQSDEATKRKMAAILVLQTEIKGHDSESGKAKAALEKVKAIIS